MPGVPTEDLKGYFDRARRFDQDRLASAITQRNTAFVVAGVFAVVAAAASFAVASLAPLKSEIPFVVAEDKSTGLPVLLSTLTDTVETEPEALTKYFLTQYVSARESYLDVEAPFAFHKVAIMSAPQEQRRFALFYNSTGADAPQILYGKKAVAEIKIRSISFLNPTLGQIHFTRFVRDVDGNDNQAARTDYVATAEFKYEHKLKLAETDRLINPVGFSVTEYRLDPEVAQ